MKLEDAGVHTALDAADGGWNTQPDMRDAAVAVILVEREGQDRVLFTRRRDDLPWHAGQVSFPGGMREADEMPQACARRETCEEIGVREEALEVLGRLRDRVSIAGFLVAPFVFRLTEAQPYAIQTSEVAEVFEVPYAFLLETSRWKEDPATHPRARVRVIPSIEYEGRNVWGLTAIIVKDFLKALEPR